MTELEQQLLAVQDQALAEIQTINDEQSFETVRAKYIGRKGSLPALMSKLGTVPPEEKPAVGKTLNAVKNAIQKAFDDRADQLKQKKEEKNALDLSLPGRKPEIGHKHPVFLVMDAAVAIFRRMGFIVADGFALVRVK